MKRKIYNKLLEWKNRWNGKTALMIDGARRVGKSWIAAEFAKNEYRSHIIIDFNNIKKEILELFEAGLTDLDNFFSLLSILTDTPLYIRDSVIVFDEVQLYPKARAAIKYFVADGRYDFIETGSLVSINRNVKDIIIPSEEVRIEMHPMDFEEFLEALHLNLKYEYIKDCFNKREPLMEGIHRAMMELFKTYIMVGGMPQAILEYRETKDLMRVEDIKKSIISLYRNDIAKYAGKQTPNVTLLFENIPTFLQQHEKKFRPSKLKKNGKMRMFADAMFWLNESRVVNFCYATTEPSVGLELNREANKVKIYLADTGLLISMIFSKENDYDNIYKKIIKGKLEFNEGMITENIIAQQLVANGHPLYFYSSYSTDRYEDRMEIDFLVRKQNITSRHNISPIEVKSSNRFGLSSLQKFESKFESYLSEAIVFYPGPLRKTDKVLYLPLYMSGLV